VMSTTAATQWIAAQTKEAGFAGDQIAEQHLQEIEKLYNKRLWHQLTDELEQFYQLGNWREGDYLIQFFRSFVSSFQEKLNSLKLAQFGIRTSYQFKDSESALDFLEKLCQAVDKDAQAKVLVKCAIGVIYLEQRKMKPLRDLLDETRELLEGIFGAEAIVNASFFLLSARFQKANENAEGYYADMLQYLSHVNAESLSEEQQIAIAYDLGIAALVGDTVFNFTELLTNGVFLSMEKSPHAWLVDTVRAFNQGEIDQYKQIIVNNKAKFAELDIFVRKETFLIEKITILALMSHVFNLSSDKRTLTFQQVAQVTRLPVDQVEFLLMRALSLNLIKGVIDQVDKSVAISWVQPRALEIAQLVVMKNKLSEWQGKVAQMQDFMYSESPELLSN